MSPSQQHIHQDPLLPDTPIPKKSVRQKVVALICILLLLGGGFLLARFMLDSKKTAVRRSPRTVKTVVQVKALQPQDITRRIQAMGTVLAAEELVLKPWLGGRIEYLHPALFPGGRLKKGEVVLRLDREDSRLILARSRNALKKARMDLRLEEGNQAVAQREYELIREYSKTAAKETPMDLALRQPQLAKVKATVAAAQTEVERAELDLARTSLTIPFDAVVLSKNVAVGSQVNAQTAMAVLVGSDAFHIRVSLPRRDLDQIVLPDKNIPEVQVKVTAVTASRQNIFYHGRILRLLSDVDPKGLMPRLLIEVKNPLTQQPGHPLLLGSVVQVELPAKTLPNSFAVPRAAVRADKTVLLADDDNQLEIRKIQSSGQDDEYIYVTDGLEPGERIILSPVAAPVAGMELSLAGKKNIQRKPGMSRD